MIELHGCTPLVSWLLFGSGILVGAAFGVTIAGALYRMREDWRVEHPSFPVDKARREEA